MTLTPQVEALEWDILALEGLEAMVVMEDLAWVMEVLGGVTEAMEEAMEDLVDMEDMEVLEVLECHLMASEEDMGELAHTATVVQVLFMGCPDLEVRGDITHLLQLMVDNLMLMVLKNLLMALNLLMVPNHLLMVLSHLHTALNLLLMMHLLHKLNPTQPMVLVQGQPMMQLLLLMLLLPTAFLLVMVVSLLLSNSRVVSSSSLEPSNSLE